MLFRSDLAPAEWHGIPVRTILALNPMTAFIDAARSATYGLSAPSPETVIGMVAWTAVALGLAWLAFAWRGRDIAEAM